MKKVEQAVACFREGFNCSQSVCSTYAEQFGVDRETALKMSAGFGGGIGRQAETCGAVTGALMVIGLQHGATHADDKASKNQTYTQAQHFMQAFTARHGSLDCRELLQCDISTPEGSEQATTQQLFATLCPQFVQSAAEILEMMNTAE